MPVGPQLCADKFLYNVCVCTSGPTVADNLAPRVQKSTSLKTETKTKTDTVYRHGLV